MGKANAYNNVEVAKKLINIFKFYVFLLNVREHNLTQCGSMVRKAKGRVETLFLLLFGCDTLSLISAGVLYTK